MSQYQAYFAPGGVDPTGFEAWEPVGDSGVNWKRIYNWSEYEDQIVWKKNWWGRPGFYEAKERVKVEVTADFKIATRTTTATEVVVVGQTGFGSNNVRKLDEVDAQTAFTAFSVDEGWKLPTRAVIRANFGNIEGVACQKQYLSVQRCFKCDISTGDKFKSFYLRHYLNGTMKKNNGLGGGYICDCDKELTDLKALKVNVCGHGERIQSPPDGFVPIGEDGENDFNQTVYPADEIP